MSLIELLVGVGLFALIGLLFNSVMLKVHQGYANVSDRVARETEAADLSFNLKHFMANAVELTEAPQNLPLPNTFSNKIGYIAPYNMDNWSVSYGTGTPIPLALYFRDTQKSLGAVKTGTDRFLPTGLFFIPPTVDHYGIVAFNFGSAKAATLTGAANQLQAHFGKVVDFKISNIISETNKNNIKKVKSFLVTFTTRSYKSKGEEARTWCPPSKMSTTVCQTSGTYSDYTWNVNVVLRNNTLGESEDRRQENKNLIPSRLEPAPRRFVEGAYFLVPELPLESMRR